MSAYYHGPIPLAEPILGLFNAHQALDMSVGQALGLQGTLEFSPFLGP